MTKRIFKVICVFCMTLLLLEQTSRFYLFGSDSFSYSKMKSLHQIGVSGLIRPSPHPGVIFEFKPNLDTYFKLARFQTNSHGLLDTEYSIQKPRNVIRTVVLGDSFTMPSGVEMEDAFHTLLEERFNRESTGKTYEFINFGVGGYDPRQCVSTFRERALAYRPDLALFCLIVPRFERFHDEKYFSEPYKVKATSNFFFESFALKLLLQTTMFDYAALEMDEERLEKYRAVFRDLRAISKKHDIPVCIVMLDHSLKDREESMKVLSLGSRLGLHTVHTGAAFKNTKLSDLVIFSIDHHPNAKANKIFSDVLYDYLKDQRLL